MVVHFSPSRSEEHTSELQSRGHLVCRLLLEKKKKKNRHANMTGCRQVIKPQSTFSPSHCLHSSPRTRYPLFPLCSSHATSTTEIYTLSLHDALPISNSSQESRCSRRFTV